MPRSPTFLPSPRPLDKIFRPPMEDGIRIETGYREGSVITPYYDPLIAKVIASAPSRDQAILRLQSRKGIHHSRRQNQSTFH